MPAKGQKVKRVCCACQQLKEQVKDEMSQNGDLTWICRPCSQARADALWARLTANLNFETIRKVM
jgi:hypothetical protein